MPISPCIFRNNTDDVFVIDIPVSIAAAQSVENILAEGSLHLTSCPPQNAPFASTEPKSRVAADRVTNHDGDSNTHKEYAFLIETALEFCKENYHGEAYCYARASVPGDLGRGAKRTAHDAFGEDISFRPGSSTLQSEVELCSVLREISHKNSRSARAPYSIHGAIEIDSSYSPMQDPKYITRESHDFLNESEKSTVLCLKPEKPDSRGYSFLIPPRSAFLLGRCEDVLPLRTLARKYAPQTRGRLDFLLIDPPWPNRSARRKSSYSSVHSPKALKHLLLGMDLDSHILPGGFIGVWVTNKTAYRDLILGSGGLFEAWNVGLVEEWIWTKITATGEPITMIDGLWRKPYEVLLIGKAPETSMDVAEHSADLKRRVMVGVPDLHSRKPCVKHLIEELLLKKKSNYKAAELFARHLVAGWLSWGDEVLKYNWDQYWVSKAAGESFAIHTY